MTWLIFLLLLAATVSFGLAAIAPGAIRPAASVAVTDDALVVQLRGPYKVFALRSSLRVPLTSVRSARVEPHARNISRGIRVGTYVPGGTIAGNFGRSSNKSFWALQGDEALVIELEGERYSRLVLEVRDPHATVALVEEARSRR